MYTFVVGSLCVLTVVAFITSFLRDVALRSLSAGEVAKPLMALVEGRAEVDEVLITSDRRYQTNILVNGKGMWFMTFAEGDKGELLLIYAQAPDYRRTQAGYKMAEVIPNERDRAAIVANLRANWALGAAWQAQHGQQYSAYSL